MEGEKSVNVNILPVNQASKSHTGISVPKAGNERLSETCIW